MPKVEISKLDHTDVRNFVTATGVQSEKSFADELACGISDRRDARSIIVGERSLDENGARQEAATKNIVFQKGVNRSEEHTSELQSLMRISYAVFCLQKKKTQLRETKDID